MADFVAVIRKAVNNLSDNSADNRAKVYEKARSAIRRQLEAMNPRPSDEMITRQLDKLDEAIDEVESENAVALPPDEEETDRLMAELEALVEEKPVAQASPSAPEPNAPEPNTPAAAALTPAPIPAMATAPVVPAPESLTPDLPENSAPAPTPEIAPPEAVPDLAGAPIDDHGDGVFPEQHKPVVAGKTDGFPLDPNASSVLTGASHDEAFGLDGASMGGKQDATRGSVHANPSDLAMQVTRHRKKSGLMGWVAGGAILLLIAGAGYAAWLQKDVLMAAFSSSDSAQQEAETTPADTASETSTDTSGEKSTTEMAAVEPEKVLPEPDGKFTQRLNPDGSETDPGPAEASSDPGPVEGRSVAAQTDPAQAPAATSETPETPQDGTSTDATEGTDTAEEQPEASEAVAQVDEPLGVVQKMFLYEERLDQQSPAVTEGSVAWSTIADPENGGPNNLAIRGEISTSDGFTALMTIKKNADRSLPASHIIEVVFALSPEFPGGAISQLQRVSMKQTEQDQGDPLIAVPAQITPDFYMVALNDLSEAVDANLSLLRDRNWIDIPVAYDNGRRALITIEKGATGSEVFNQVLDVWAAG